MMLQPVFHVQASFERYTGTLTNSETIPVVRKFINPAVYIETPLINMMPPLKKNSFHLDQNDSGAISARFLKVKRCVCSTDRENCPCHPEFVNKSEETSTKFSSSSNSSVSGVTIRKINSSRENTKSSQTSLATNTTTRLVDEEERQKIFKEWLAKKYKEKLKQQRKEESIKQIKEQERQIQLEKERENFRKWLANKKKEEEEKQRAAKERELEIERIKEQEKERRNLEKELHYQLWLKKKEKEQLEKKIEEKTKIIQAAEERQRRLEESARAYEEWLKNSKNKPKPLPLNQGLDSLRASVSVTYVNPTPWIPNVEKKVKPESQ